MGEGGILGEWLSGIRPLLSSVKDFSAVPLGDSTKQEGFPHNWWHVSSTDVSAEGCL